MSNDALKTQYSYVYLHKNTQRIWIQRHTPLSLLLEVDIIRIKTVMLAAAASGISWQYFWIIRELGSPLLRYGVTAASRTLGHVCSVAYSECRRRKSLDREPRRYTALVHGKSTSTIVDSARDLRLALRASV